MSDEPYDVSIDPAAGIVVARARAFWTMETLHAFTADIMLAGAQVERCGRPFLLLVDTREHGVQGREVVEGLQRWARSDAVRGVRTAVLVASALYRRQANRIRSEGSHEIFADESEARAWLTDLG